ncbi:helix-turn-helix domain-containing protein [Alistipes finegoldii]
MEEQTKEEISKILRLVLEILEEIHYLKEHRSMLEGDPILEFSEVCQMLRQSERQVRRYREQGRLVGFNFGHRRMYLLSEVQEFIRKMRKQGKLEALKDTNL